LLAILLFAHIALVFMLLGGGVLDTYVSFPNWFHNIPDSLVTAKQFYSFRHPGYFFIPVLLLVIFSGVAFVVAAWKHEPARIWVLVGTVLFVAIAVMNVGFIYPRLSMVIGEGSETRALEVLQAAAQELQVLIQVRLVLSIIGTGFAVFGLWRFYANAPKMQGEAEAKISD
jgi:hypothetical protein